MDNNNSLNESLFGFDDVPNNNQSSSEHSVYDEDLTNDFEDFTN